MAADTMSTVGEMIRDMFVQDKRSRDELLALDFKLPQNGNTILQGPIEPLSDARKLCVVFSQMAIHRNMIGEGINIIGNLTESLGLGRPPNPTYHWGLLVGDYVHELSCDETTHPGFVLNFYRNVKYVKGEWEVYEVGRTFYPDWAINLAGIQAIEEMHPLYNYWHNNCQSFVINLLNIVSSGSRKHLWSMQAIAAGTPFTTISGQTGIAAGALAVIPTQTEVEQGQTKGEQAEVAETVHCAQQIMHLKRPLVS